jgi:ferredoxin
MTYFRVNENCNGCLACVQNCPAAALDYLDRSGRRTLRHNMARCARCGQCWRICPQHAIEFQHLLKGAWDEVAAFDLVLCSVCGEPLYTAAFARTLEGCLDKTPDHACPQHRQHYQALARAYFGKNLPAGDLP